MTHRAKVVVLLLCCSLFALPVYAQTRQDIAPGDTVEGTLGEEQRTQEYRFEASAGETVSITLLSDDFDPLLVLLDSGRQEIAYNDDGGPGSLNSRIGPITLPDAGTYIIVANSYANYFNSTLYDVPSGSFTLILESVDVRRIEYTQQLKSELGSASAYSYFQFRGQAGDVINISAASETFSPSLSLSLLGAGSPGLTLTGADASAEGVAFIGGYQLPETASYLLALHSSSGTSGTFTLEIERVQVTALEMETPVEIVFDEENRLAFFSFEGAAGEVLSLTVRSEDDLDTTLSLTGPEGYQIAYADDTYGRDPALVNYILPQTGSYSVIVQPYQAGTSGSATLTLEPGVLLSLDDGPQIVELNSQRTRETLTLNASSGEQVRLTLEVVGGGSASPNIAVTQGQQNFAYASGSSVTRLALDVTVPGDGLVYFQLDDYSYTNIRLHVSAERLPMTAAQETASATPTPFVPPQPTETPVSETTPEPLIEDEDGLIDITDEPFFEATATGAPAEVTETPEPEATGEPDATAEA